MYKKNVKYSYSLKNYNYVCISKRTDMKKLILALLVVLCYSCTKEDEPFSVIGKTYAAKNVVASTQDVYYINLEFKNDSVVIFSFHENSPIGAVYPSQIIPRTYKLSYPNITFSNGTYGKFISPTELMTGDSESNYILQP